MVVSSATSVPSWKVWPVARVPTTCGGRGGGLRHLQAAKRERAGLWVGGEGVRELSVEIAWVARAFDRKCGRAITSMKWNDAQLTSWPSICRYTSFETACCLTKADLDLTSSLISETQAPM